MHILLHLGEILYKYQLSPAHLVSFKARVSLLIFCLDDLSIDESGGIKVFHYYCVTVDFFLCIC